MTTQLKDVVVRFKTLDGRWETAGVDRLRGIYAEVDSATADEYGPSKASINLRRDPGMTWPDLAAFSDVEIEDGGVLVWDGRIAETPLSDGDDPVVNVQCEGWQRHLDDDTYSHMYVHRTLADWRDSRSYPTQVLTRYVSSPTVSNDRGVITIGWADGSPARTNDVVGITLDTGVGAAARVVFTWANNLADANILMYVWGTNTANALDGTDSRAVNGLSPAGSGSGPLTPVTSAASLASGTRRFMHFLLLYTGPGGTYTTEQVVRFTDIQVYADATYESGNASILKTPTIIKDALSRGTLLLSTDRSGIDPTGAATFALPEFTPDGQRTPREIIDAANAVQDFRFKIAVGKRPVYEPKPAVAALEVGDWPGCEFADASANSGAEIYNRVIVEGTGADGEKLSVERSQAQQAGVAFDVLSTPVADNPSFATATTSWTPSGTTTMTRTTTAGEFDTAPAGGKWGNFPIVLGSTLVETFTGTFFAGVTYRLALAIAYQGPNQGPPYLDVVFGVGGDVGTARWAGTGAFVTQSITWTPVTTVSSGVTLKLAVVVGTPATWLIDSLVLSAAKPTLVDRRGFRRTHILPINAALTTELGQQIGDVWLAAHKTTPLRGTVKVTGDSAVRHILTGQSIPPSQLLLRTGDMLRLSHRVDPDTGGQGRDGRIAEVTWRPADDAADVALDNARTSVDALLERLAVVVGSA